MKANSTFVEDIKAAGLAELKGCGDDDAMPALVEIAATMMALGCNILRECGLPNDAIANLFLDVQLGPEPSADPTSYN